MHATDDPPWLATLKAEVPPALERLLITARDTLHRVAERDGYGPAEVEWMEKHMLPPLLQRLVDQETPETVFHETYGAARRALLVAIFEQRLAETGQRAAAFRSLVDLEYDMAERLGTPAPSYSVALVEAGCDAVAASAAEGHAIEDQIETGFAMMRELQPLDALAAATPPSAPPQIN